MTEDLNALFRQLTHGVYVIGVTGGGRDNAFTASWVMQVSFAPLLLALSVNPRHASYGILVEGGVFSVNVLPGDRQELARRFGERRDSGRLDAVPWHRGGLDVPVLDEAMAYFECEVRADYPAGDHRLILGRARAGAVTRPGAVPMLYRDTGDMDGSSRLFPDGFYDAT